MNILQKYLEIRKETVSSFALKSGISQATLWRIVNNKFKPSPGTALKIERATKGQVTRMELLYPEPVDPNKTVPDVDAVAESG